MSRARLSFLLCSSLLSACFDPTSASETEDGDGSAGSGDDGAPGTSGGASMTTAGSSMPSTSGNDSDPSGPDSGSMDTDPDPDSSSGGSSGSMATDTTGGDESTSTGPAAFDEGGTQVCAPDAGADWSAPFALASADSGCGADFPDEVVATLLADLGADPAMCDCSCGDPTTSCSTSMTATGYSGPACTVGEGAVGVSQNQCYSQVLSDTHSLSLGNASSSCGSGSVNETIPAVTWSSSDIGCGTTPIDAVCPEATDHCLPQPEAPFGAGLCVMQDGDQECPAGYPDKTLYYQDYDDTRDCPTSCSCTSVGASCSVSVQRFTQSGCSGTQLIPNINVSSGSSACIIQNSVHSMRPGNVSVQNAGTCSPGTANPSGAATPTGAISVCCM